MVAVEAGSHVKAAAFKLSVAADLYTAEDVIDIAAIEAAAGGYSAEISLLKRLIDESSLDQTQLGGILVEYPRLYQVLCTMLSISTSVELADGRRLPSPLNPPRDISTSHSVAGILLELGIATLLHDSSALSALFLMVQIQLDAPKRRFRVDARIKARIQHVVELALVTATQETGRFFELGSKGLLPLNEGRIIEYVITVDGKARFAIATTFQTHSGGRQTREMRILYPSVHATLASKGISMILIADGQGMRELPEKVLAELFRSVPNTMSIAQAEAGAMLKAFATDLANPVLQHVDSAGLRQLIETALEVGPVAKASSLPVSDATARLALANYASSNSHLSLKLADDGVSLEWRNTALVRLFRDLGTRFVGTDAIRGFSSLLRAQTHTEVHLAGDQALATIELAGDELLASKFVVYAAPARVDAVLLREVARQSLQYAPESKVAVLISVELVAHGELQELRDAQAFLPVTVVVVDIRTCLEMAQSRELPRDRLRTLLLDQTDLTKLSPFVVRGVTPARVFFGREEEEATLLSTLSTNSVALLGGRRIGKTSLMRHSSARLTSANLKPYFGDCQVVRTWEDFGFMAARNWKVALPEKFKPQHLFDLVDQLRADSDRPVVILLDEVDQLLDWDTSHTDDEVPEAFFRACRSISQQGLAQFVFSGERIIANRLWDATSPHWNFCRPLMLQQLGREAADSLIAEPLEALGVRLEQRSEFLLSCWESTDGHPELLQFLGDKIVAEVNRRDRTDVFASPEDVQNITAQFEFAEQYLETYWGQATPIERVISILLIRKKQSIDELTAGLKAIGVVLNGAEVHAALRMLELYGIAQQSNSGYELKARWFMTALSSYGGADVAINRYLGAAQL